MPLALTLGLALLSFVPRVSGNPILARSFWGAAIVLLVWQLALFLRLKGASEGRSLTTVLRPQHYLQALVQVAVFVYWGWFWRPVYDFVWLLVAQLVFAYAFDMLLAWTRRGSYVLGFGPFPIIFSTNLFLWFRDDWFYLQFLMLAVGFMGKEFVRWHRDGKRVHIFNPLRLFVGAVLAGIDCHEHHRADLGAGDRLDADSRSLHLLVSVFDRPDRHVLLFDHVGRRVRGNHVIRPERPVYGAVTGVPYFVDSEIPSAVFLGLHLLVTDPSTSPRTPLGKSIFGGLYGLGVFGLYALLGALGAPTFYDKLLCVPLLNLSVQAIDGLVRTVGKRPGWNRWRRDWAPARANLAFMSVWIIFFGAMTALGRTDARHTGDSLPFWQQACQEGRRNACERLIQLESSYCGDNSGWACNELGSHYMEGRITDADSELATAYFSRACEVRFQAGLCQRSGAGKPKPGGPAHSRPPTALTRGGQNLMQMPEQELYARACDHGWTFACGAGVRSL